MTTTKPKALVTYSGQGGSAMGYHRAGFSVFCVDLHPQPRCPFPFVQADAVDFIGNEGHRFDMIEGGPVCKAYSKTARIHNAGHPEQIPATRAAMLATGKPYVIENVEDARPELVDPVMLCGPSFGLRTYRHRLFESNLPLTAPEHMVHEWPTVKMGRPVRDGEFYHAVGNFSGVSLVREDMGVPWMNREGINQCIPPVYAEWVGRRVLAQLGC